jgi:hypothetical protein
MAGKGRKGGPFGGSPEERPPYGYPAPESYDDDTVTIVVPRRAAEDFYYAISLALGSRVGLGGRAYPRGKKGGPPPDEMTPKPVMMPKPVIVPKPWPTPKPRQSSK